MSITFYFLNFEFLHLCPFTSHLSPFTPIFERMAEIKINVINKSGNQLPSYASPGASGMDIRADLTDALTLAPMQRTLIPTGLFIEIPEGYEAQIRPRSGL